MGLALESFYGVIFKNKWSVGHLLIAGGRTSSPLEKDGFHSYTKVFLSAKQVSTMSLLKPMSQKQRTMLPKEALTF